MALCPCAGCSQTSLSGVPPAPPLCLGDTYMSLESREIMPPHPGSLQAAFPTVPYLRSQCHLLCCLLSQIGSHLPSFFFLSFAPGTCLVLVQIDFSTSIFSISPTLLDVFLTVFFFSLGDSLSFPTWLPKVFHE